MHQVVTGNLPHVGFNAVVFMNFCTQRYINAEIGKYTKLTGHLTHQDTRELAKYLEDDYDNGLIGHRVGEFCRERGFLSIDDLHALALEYDLELKHLFFILSLCLDVRYAQHHSGVDSFLPHQFRRKLFYRLLVEQHGKEEKARIDSEIDRLVKENNLPVEDAEVLVCAKNHMDLACQMSYSGLFYIPCTRFISHKPKVKPQEFRKLFQNDERLGLRRILDDAVVAKTLDDFRKGCILTFASTIGVKVNKASTQQQVILWEYAQT